MSKIEVLLKDDILRIEKKTSRFNEDNIEKIQLNLLEDGKLYNSRIKVTNPDEKNIILFLKDNNTNEEQPTILVYAENRIIKYIKSTDKEKIFKKLVKLRFKVINMGLTKKNIKLKILAFLINPFNLNIEETKFFVDDILNTQCTLKQYPKMVSKMKMIMDKNIHKFRFKIDDIIQDESSINGRMRFTIISDGQEINYNISKKNKTGKKNRLYYLPIKGKYVKDFAIHIRRTLTGGLILVKRKKELIEDTLRFKIFESKFISFSLYIIGKIGEKIRKKKINIFYEKFSEKSEEGVFDLCQKCETSEKTKNYFVIDEKSLDYKKIYKNKNVVKKYSLKYYWLFYNASNFISSDTPLHLNILRSNNKYLRKAIYEKKFIFLQHGITYLKCHGKNSPYINGKEGTFDYIVVGSEKEKDVVVDMLQYDENQILNLGLPIFSKIQYKHINQKSEDYISIMLTWKPYEEQLYNFEDSSYFNNVNKIYNLLLKYIDEEKIIIIGHPKTNTLLKGTKLEKYLWKGRICEALEKTKMLITDYSSVCYNSFYQGAGVIFYQEDLDKFELENGKLIPNDDEYIGKRAFSIEELEEIVKSSIKDKKILLERIRTEEYENRYKLINEFSDGKNIDRIYSKLLELKIV